MAGMLRAAHGRHWQATLCVLYPRFSLAAELAADGIPVVELHGGTFDPRRLASLRRLARSGEHDVVHSSLWGANAFARIACLGPRRPAVVISERRVEEFRPAWARAFDRALRPVVDRYVANSSAVADFVARAHGVGHERVAEVPNGIDLSVFHPGAAAAGAEERRTARLGCVGRLVSQKGVDTVIAALPAVLDHREVRLAIAGEGEQRAALEAAAAGLPVEFVGYLATPGEVAGFLRGLDLFVTASRYEGRPNAVLEARACGLPVVATDVAGMAEACGTDVTLVPPDDPPALAAAVLEALAAIDTATATAPAPPPVTSFDDVARAHLEAFHAAVRRRHTA